MEAHALAFVGGFLAENRQRAGDAITPVAEYAHGGGAGIGARGFQNAVEQRDVDDVMPLMQPERFGKVVLIIGVRGVERGDPSLGGGDHGGGVVFAELDFGEVADLVFGALEQIKQRRNRLAVDDGRGGKRTAFVGEAIDAPVDVVAVGIAEMALEVTDQGIVPVDHVDRAIGPDVGVDGAEIFLRRRHEVGLTDALDPGAVGLERDAKNALKANHVGVKIIAPILLGEMRARNDRAAGGGARRTFPNLFQPRVFLRVIEATAEGRAKVGGIAGGVGDDIVAPAVEGAAVRIGEAVSGVGLEFPGARLKTKKRAVDVAHGPEGGLNLRAVEDAVAEQNRAAGLVDERVGGVMGVGGVEAHEDFFAGVGLAVAVGVADEPEIRRLHDEQAVLVELKAGRAIQVVEVVGEFVGFAVTVGVFEDDDAVTELGGGGAARVVGPDGDPEAALGVPGHLHGFGEFGEFALAGEQVHLHSGGEFHLRHGLLRGEELVGPVGVGAGLVGAERSDQRKREHLGRGGFALGGSPEDAVAVGRDGVALFHLLLHDLIIGDFGLILDGFVGDLRPVTVDIVAIDRAVAGMPLGVFLVHGFLEPGEIADGRRFAKKGFKNHGGKSGVAGLVEVNAVDRERPAGLGGLGEQFLRRGVEIDEGHTGAIAGDLGHRGGVEREVAVVRRRDFEIFVGMGFVGDRREQHDLRRAAGAVIFGAGVAEERIEIRLEFREAGGTGEGFVETEEGKNHIGADAGEPLVGGAKVFGTGAGGQFVAGDGEIAHDEFVLRILRVNERLERAEMLHAIGERVADEGDLGAGIEGERRVERGGDCWRHGCDRRRGLRRGRRFRRRRRHGAAHGEHFTKGMVGGFDAGAIAVEAIHARGVTVERGDIGLGRNFEPGGPVGGIYDQPAERLVLQVDAITHRGDENFVFFASGIPVETRPSDGHRG